MLDYRGLEALFTVIQLQSFEAAANKLFITQSAISQRIKSLENYYGCPLLVRTLPYQPTQLGKYLLGHFKRISLLEETLAAEIAEEAIRPTLTIAINRDSLDTWFLEVMKKANIFNQIILEIIADDQEITLDYLKQGLVSACLSTSNKSHSGCYAEFIGDMEYLLVASPEFKEKYFNKRSHKENLLQAPAIIFDSKDTLHERYLQRFFNIYEPPKHCHLVPSVSGFREFALRGYGYALIPKIDIKQDLDQEKLINLYPNKVWHMPLYWHSWAIESSVYKAFNRIVIESGQTLLDI